MKDAALASLISTLLRFQTKGEAVAHAANVGSDHSDLINKLVSRLTWKRTLSQNALLHKWYGEIAEHLGDRSASQVKGECHRKYGLPIRLRDPQFAWVWKHRGADLNYEQQCSFLASGVLSISSAMTTKELTEYLDAMATDYRAAGFRLTEPDR